MRDLHNNLTPVVALDPAVLTTDATSAYLDLAGFEGAEVFMNLGASATSLSGSVTVSGKLLHSDASGSGFVAVPEAEMLGAVAGTTTGEFFLADDPTEDECVHSVGYIGGKRYLKVMADLTGTFSGGGIPVGAVLVKGVARHEA